MDAMTADYWPISTVLAAEITFALYLGAVIKGSQFVIGQEGHDGWQAEKDQNWIKRK